MDTAKKKAVKRSPLIRITAAVLAVIMISSVILYNRSGVTLREDTYEEKGNRVAARELLKDDKYANASRLEQMSAFARNLLSGKRTQEDLELGVEISIAQANYTDAISLTGRMLEEFEGTDQELGKLYLRLGYLYVMTKDADSALKWLNEGIHLAPTAEAYLTRAQVYLDRDNLEAAVTDANVSLAMAGDSIELIPNTVNIFEAAGQYEKAVELYAKLVDRTGGTEYLVNRAWCLSSLGRLEEASEDRDRYEREGGKELGSTDVMLGIGWMRAKDYAKADDCFVRAISENYADPESLYYYVVLCSYVTRNFERVCTYGDILIDKIREGTEGGTADVALEKSTGKLNITLVKMDRASVYLMTGASHLQTAGYGQAESCLTACLAEDPSAVYAYYLRGISRMAAGKYTEAITDFDAAIAADEETERSRYSRAVCRMETGDRDGAVEDYDWVVLYGTDESLVDEAGTQMLRLLNEQEEAESPQEPEGSDN